MKRENSQSGFVVLFTVLLASIMLAIAIGVGTIAFKEILLSKTAAEAGGSFLAADSGVECGLFQDYSGGLSVGSALEQCEVFDQDIVVQGAGGEDTFLFYMPVDVEGDGSVFHCAEVLIEKGILIEGFDVNQLTSRGYNASCEDIEARRLGTLEDSIPNLVERVIQVRYLY
jgi:hypothetical protein